MGANLCSFRHPTSDQEDQPHDHDEAVSHANGVNNSPSQSCSAILELIRRPAGCLQKTDDNQTAKKRSSTSNALAMHPPPDDQEKIKKSKVMRKLTLEELIMNSPASHVKKPDFHSGGELHVFRHSSTKVHPSANSSSSRSSPFDNRMSLAAKAKDSFCLEPVVKRADPKDHGAAANSMSRRRSGKLTKRVRFREEPDIAIIYSPD